MSTAAFVPALDEPIVGQPDAVRLASDQAALFITSLPEVNGIAWGKGRYVAVGRFGEIFSSP
jgi:hypothetical protein